MCSFNYSENLLRARISNELGKVQSKRWSLLSGALGFINLGLVTNHGDKELIELLLPGGENEKYPETHTKI